MNKLKGYTFIKKKGHPRLTLCAELGRHRLVVSEPRFRPFWKSLRLRMYLHNNVLTSDVNVFVFCIDGSF